MMPPANTQMLLVFRKLLLWIAELTHLSAQLGRPSCLFLSCPTCSSLSDYIHYACTRTKIQAGFGSVFNFVGSASTDKPCYQTLATSLYVAATWLHSGFLCLSCESETTICSRAGPVSFKSGLLTHHRHMCHSKRTISGKACCTQHHCMPKQLQPPAESVYRMLYAWQRVYTPMTMAPSETQG